MTTQQDYISIGDMAQKTKVSIYTLRLWDRTGKLKPASKLSNGTRLYSPEQVAQCIAERKRELQAKLDALETQAD